MYQRSKGTNYPYNAMTAISTFSIGNAAYAMIASQSNDWVAILNITEPANPTHLTVLVVKIMTWMVLGTLRQ